MTDKIRTLIESYKDTSVIDIDLTGDYLVLKVTTSRSGNYPKMALKILNKYPEIRVVHFTGNWIEGVYTRETLKWAGYKVK